MALSTKSEADILARVIGPNKSGLSPEAARSIMSLTFDPADVARMNELSREASEGSLSEEEQDELDRYERVGHLLAILQSKARVSLKNVASESPQAPPQ